MDVDTRLQSFELAIRNANASDLLADQNMYEGAISVTSQRDQVKEQVGVAADDLTQILRC